MSIRHDSSLLQRSRKNTPDLSIATNQGDIQEKDHLAVNVEIDISPEHKPQSRQQRNRIRIHWVKNHIFLNIIASSLSITVIFIFTFIKKYIIRTQGY